MAYGDKILLGILGITAILVACCFIIHKIHSYRVNKYNNEVKNKLKNTAKYLFGDIYNEYFDDNCPLNIPTRYRYNLFAKTIFVDKKDVKKMIGFAEHVYKKYYCDYTVNIWLMAGDVKRFARWYSSLENYLFEIGCTEKNLKAFAENHKDEIIEIEKEKFFNMK